ncbi:MAG TPA: hypothetical protein DCZ23_02810 [Lachnospiraceae bacterium]|nr:hypothetical protein [Lachnospiraceae bacterium]
MGRKTKYFCGICAMLVLFAIGNYASYQSALRHFEKMQEDSRKKTYDQFEAYVSEKIDSRYKELEEEQQTEDNVSADTSDYDKLGVQTIYQIESYNSVKDTTVVEYETLPEELIGLTREQTDDYCRNYIKNMPAEEFLKGLQSMGVTGFSNERLVVKKIYDSSKVEFKYYLIAVDGEVVAYYGDKKTVYEYTGIETRSLPAKERRALKKGIEVSDEEELYSILENYSS